MVQMASVALALWHIAHETFWVSFQKKAFGFLRWLPLTNNFALLIDNFSVLFLLKVFMFLIQSFCLIAIVIELIKPIKLISSLKEPVEKSFSASDSNALTGS